MRRTQHLIGSEHCSIVIISSSAILNHHRQHWRSTIKSSKKISKFNIENKKTTSMHGVFKSLKFSLFLFHVRRLKPAHRKKHKATFAKSHKGLESTGSEVTKESQVSVLFKKAKAVTFASTLNSTDLLLISAVNSEPQFFKGRITYTYTSQWSMAKFNLNYKFKQNCIM